MLRADVSIFFLDKQSGPARYSAVGGRRPAANDGDAGKEISREGAGKNVKVISGGQTGVDRGALDAARALGLKYGGAVPRGRRTEAGPLPPGYAGMTELSSISYRARTEKNVRDAEGTLILYRGKLRGGTALTARLAKASGKPCLKINLGKTGPNLAAERIRAWLAEVKPGVLNVAGPRESAAPGIGRQAEEILLAALKARRQE